jgi:pimeloyl-ACP methyl ester carboxylesterase
MNNAVHLVLLPGLGTDHRLLAPQRRAFPDLQVPAWIQPKSRESLPDYAARLAGQVAVPPGKRLVIGGVSFGGMLALEMARHLRPAMVLLIASCRGPESLRPILRLGRWLLPPATYRAWIAAQWLAGPVMRLRLQTPRPHREALLEMFKQSDPRFMHWTVRAILGWRPTPLEDIPIRHIHGRRDPLIPIGRVQADEIIPRGRHVINLTHAEEVNAFIRRAVQEL